MSLNDDIALLSTVPLFNEISDDKLRLIAFGAERRSLLAGQELFREGTMADCAYVVAGGELTLTAKGRDGKPRLVNTVGRGTLLSELALISAVERKFTAKAETGSEVMRINRQLFHRMLEEYPEIGALMETRLTQNFQSMVARLEALQGKFA